jgi:hypothetical protein
MAPSNLNQVFVANDISDTTNGTILDGSTFLVNAAPAASLIGVWNVATGAYLTTSMMATTVNGPLQIVQTMPSGTNPIASPLIERKDIKRIKYTPYAASQRHTIAATFSATVPTGATYLVKAAIRTAPTAYAGFDQLSPSALDLSGGGKVFPLLGNFSAGRNLLHIVEIAAGTTAANCGIAVTNAIQADPVLSSLFTVSDNGSGVVTIVARHAGVIFDVVAANTVSETSVISTSTTGFDAGSGNYWQVLSDEKSQRARYGNFNRMYFPIGFPEFAVSGNTYEVVEITYATGWPSSTGIARAGELNTIKIYNKVAAEGATKADIVFLGSDASDWGTGPVEILF